MKTGKKFMEEAIKDAEKGIRKGQSPFGACIVKGNEIVSCGHNTVLKDQDATCHAEINAIHKASKKLLTFDLSGCTIYSTTEPCPMCFSAIHWARIDNVVYGTNIQDVKKLGFSELTISNVQMKKLGKSRVKIKKDFMRQECLLLLKNWEKGKGDIY
jgi:tRNA(Arg) A34 adenosine deaminase TadA